MQTIFPNTNTFIMSAEHLQLQWQFKLDQLFQFQTSGERNRYGIFSSSFAVTADKNI